MKRKIILVADDDPKDVEILRRLLREASVLNPAHSVDNGEEAIAYLAGSGKYADRDLYPYPTLLLLDLVMPQRSGLAVLRWIQSRPQSHHTALGIIVMTYMGNNEGIKQAYAMGAHSFLIKPLPLADLVNLLNGLKGLHLELAEGGRYLNFDVAAIQ